MSSEVIVRSLTVALLITFAVAIGLSKLNLLPSDQYLSARGGNLESIMKSCAPRVAKETMSALIGVESAWRPFAIHINAKGITLSRQPQTKEEAVNTARMLLSKGYNIDMGYAQINSSQLQRLNIRVEDLFDTCMNLRVAEKILIDCYTRGKETYGEERKTLGAALSCYNTGNFSGGFKNGYVGKIYRSKEVWGNKGG